MTQNHFKLQIGRLQRTWGEKHYPAERTELFWEAFRECSENVFASAVSNLIATERNAPMLDELSKAVETARLRQNSSRTAGSGGYLSMMEEMAKNTKLADPDFVKACVRTLKSKLDGKLPGQEFFKHCDELDYVAKQLGRGSPTPPAVSPRDLRAQADR